MISGGPSVCNCSIAELSASTVARVRRLVPSSETSRRMRTPPSDSIRKKGEVTETSYARLTWGQPQTGCGKTRFCTCFWVAQRFTAAISVLLSMPALAAEATLPAEEHFFRNLFTCAVKYSGEASPALTRLDLDFPETRDLTPATWLKRPSRPAPSHVRG